MGYTFRSAEYPWLQQWMSHAASGWLQRDDVRLEGGKIIIEDRGSGRQIVLAASMPL